MRFVQFAFLYLTATHFVLTPLLADRPNQLSPTEERALQEQFNAAAHEAGSLLLAPPEGWRLADPKSLPPNVQVMVVGKGRHEMPPSINLGTEAFQGSLKDYLKVVKSINDAQGVEWKDLGSIRTDAGEGSLSQVDVPSEWGTLRLMHVILLKDGTAYIVTAAALKDEFPTFYKDFFKAFRSLRFAPQQALTAAEQPLSSVKKASLEQAKNTIKRVWKNALQKEQLVNSQMPADVLKRKVFASDEFQQHWQSFKLAIQQKFAELDESWKDGTIASMEQELMASKL